MSDYLDDNRTEGPEGYFVESSPARSAAAQTRGERRNRPGRSGGRRLEDAELRRAHKRLMWINATLGAVLASALVMAVAERLE